MKIVGIVGILLLVIGLIVIANTLTSDYATSACQRAAQDQSKFDEAKTMCGSVTSDCYRQATAGLTSEDECQNRTDFMTRQLFMGVIPAVIGGVLAFVGLIMAIAGFVLARRKKAVATA
jgi:ABC-type antimicrobial peptide transport system permease subunit